MLIKIAQDHAVQLRILEVVHRVNDNRRRAMARKASSALGSTLRQDGRGPRPHLQARYRRKLFCQQSASRPLERHDDQYQWAPRRDPPCGKQSKFAKREAANCSLALHS